MTDAGVAHLGRLTKVRLLVLHNARVTDAGLASLHGLPELMGLDLKDTDVTDRGVSAFRAARPQLKISR